MVEEEQYCIDILTQVSAATKALAGGRARLLDEHLAHCVVDAVAAARSDEADTKLQARPPSHRPPGPVLTRHDPRKEVP